MLYNSEHTARLGIYTANSAKRVVVDSHYVMILFCCFGEVLAASHDHHVVTLNYPNPHTHRHTHTHKRTDEHADIPVMKRAKARCQIQGTNFGMYALPSYKTDSRRAHAQLGLRLKSNVVNR